MHAQIASRRPTIEMICRRFHVRRLDVVGSAARGGDFDETTSDADFLVEFDKDAGLPSLSSYFQLQSELSELLGRPVDLIDLASVRNPIVRDEILRYREAVYAS